MVPHSCVSESSRPPFDHLRMHTRAMHSSQFGHEACNEALACYILFVVLAFLRAFRLACL